MVIHEHYRLVWKLFLFKNMYAIFFSFLSSSRSCQHADDMDRYDEALRKTVIFFFDMSYFYFAGNAIIMTNLTL